MLLADTSAWWIARRPEAGEVRSTFDAMVRRSKVAICDVVRFELLYSARNGDELAFMASRLADLPDMEIAKRHWRRALTIYRKLGHQGGAHHRSVGYPDLLIAATAEAAGIPVLHYDEDFERIAEITGQPTRWIVPRGSV